MTVNHGPRSWLENPRPGRGVRFADDEGGWEYREYAELAAAARRVASALLADGVGPDDVVCVLLPTGFECLAAFFGAWVAGATPCLIAPPALARREEYIAGVARILAQARPAVLVTSPQFAEDAARAAEKAGTDARPWLWRQGAEQAPVAKVGPDDAALLQFTSGSSGARGGVRVSWANLAANIAMVRCWAEWEDTDAFSLWLPLYHDMGLGSVLVTVAAQGDLWLMRPAQFIRDPARWLDCMAATQLTAAPSFAFEYAARKVPPERLAGLDLSGRRVLWVGAEPIDPVALEDFARLTARAGFSRSMFMPAYGMAEATLAVTAAARGEAPLVVRPAPGTVRLGQPVRIERECRLGDIPDLARNGWMVGCGAPCAGTEVAVLGEDGAPLPPGHLGEVAVRGPAVTAGYHSGRGDGGAAATRFIGGQLRTGDAGFLYRDQLFVLGRMGDSLKLRGRHVFVEDLENRVLDVTGLPRQRCAVVSVAGSDDAGVALFVEAPAAEWVQPARQVLRAVLGPEAGIRIVAGAPGMIARTTSGKPRRRLLWERYRSGQIPGARPLDPEGGPEPEPGRPADRLEETGSST